MAFLFFFWILATCMMAVPGYKEDEENLPVVPVEEMEASFCLVKAPTYCKEPLIRHQHGFWGLWVDCPEKVDSMFGQIRDGRFYWNSDQVNGNLTIVLDSIVSPDKEKAAQMMERLKQTYGTSTSGSALAIWLDGQVGYLIHPRPLMTFLVSPWKGIMDIRQGRRFARSRKQSGMGDYTREVERYEHALYEDWGFTIYLENLLFTHDVMRNVRVNPDFEGEETCDFLLIAENDGTFGFRLLLPHELTSGQELRITELRKAIEAIPYKLFTPMYTSDGRWFPGRYYRGVYTREGWRFTDYLMLQERWEYIRCTSLPRQDENWYEKFNILRENRR